MFEISVETKTPNWEFRAMTTGTEALSYQVCLTTTEFLVKKHKAINFRFTQPVTTCCFLIPTGCFEIVILDDKLEDFTNSVMNL